MILVGLCNPVVFKGTKRIHLFATSQIPSVRKISGKRISRGVYYALFLSRIMVGLTVHESYASVPVITYSHHDWQDPRCKWSGRRRLFGTTDVAVVCFMRLQNSLEFFHKFICGSSEEARQHVPVTDSKNIWFLLRYLLGGESLVAMYNVLLEPRRTTLE